MKHTPGPWGSECALSSDMYNIRYITGPDCQKICDVNHRTEMTQEEALANAALIKAAPDLLLALMNCQQALANAIHTTNASSASPIAWRLAWKYAEDKARAVVSKATGGAS